jgi:L-methionine (R)-S-oxide reductase
MFHLNSESLPQAKTELYEQLATDVKSLLDQETDWIANTANVSALLYHALPEVNWAGFYFMRNGELVVGPFQGKPACVRIAVGRGVCGTAAQKRQAIIVRNVHEFPGHIACDSASNSEIVIPLIIHDVLIGVLDIDSPVESRFDDEDRGGLERVLQIFLEKTKFD